MQIYLRPISLDDTKLIIKWRNNPKIQDHCLKKGILTKEMHENHYKNNIVTGKYVQYIVERIEEEFCVASYSIATVYLKDMDYFNKKCELCIFTSNEEEWNSESQELAIKMLIDIAFHKYNMHKIYSYVFSKNKDELNLLLNSGFLFECLMKEEALDISNNYCDLIRVSIYNK